VRDEDGGDRLPHLIEAYDAALAAERGEEER